MNDLPGEKVLIESDNQVLVLTTHRVRYDAIGKSTGWVDRAEVISIMLEELAACAIMRVHYPILLLLALVGLLILLLVEGGAIVGIVLAALSLGGFLFSQRQVLMLVSTGGVRIQVNTSSMSLQSVREFIDEVEKAKNERFLA